MLSVSPAKQERIAFLKIGDILLHEAVFLTFIAVRSHSCCSLVDTPGWIPELGGW